MHERRRIRELVVQILTDDAQDIFTLTPVVEDSPAHPITTKRGGDVGLRVRVYLEGDTRVGDEREKQDPLTYLREATLGVQCVIQASQIWDWAPVLDGFCEEVEAVLSKYLANNLNNSVQVLEYAETEVTYADTDSELTYGMAAIRYDVQFRTTAWVAHPDLDGTDIEYNLQDAEGNTHPDAPHAEDTADVAP